MGIKLIICAFKGHKVDTSESLVGDIMLDKRNWLCKCHRCGMYVMHDGATSGGTITVTESQAKQIKMEFEMEMAEFARNSLIKE